MRLTVLLTGVGLSAAASLAASASAADLIWGRNGIAPHQQALSAAGEGRRDWLKLNCYGCHGMNAAGGMGPNVQHRESGDVSDAVLNGAEGGMPPFRKYVKSVDIKNITAYLASIGTKNEPTFVDWWKVKP